MNRLFTKVFTPLAGQNLLPLCSSYIDGVAAASRQELVELLTSFDILEVQTSACSCLVLRDVYLLFVP